MCQPIVVTFTHDDRYDDRSSHRSSYRPSKHCLRIWPRPLACLRRPLESLVTQCLRRLYSSSCSLQMEEEEENDLLLVTCVAAAAAVIVIAKRRKRRQQRRRRTLWTRRWLTERDGDRGMSHFLHSELDPSGFHGFLRMNSDTFKELLDLISPAIATQDTWIRDSISAEQKLVVTLRYLATGLFYCWFVSFSRSSIHIIPILSKQMLSLPYL